MANDFNFQELKKKWPSALVAREMVSEFTGGLISSRYIANLDSAGHGVPDRIRIGRKVAYPIDSLIEWLEKRASNIGPKVARNR